MLFLCIDLTARAAQAPSSFAAVRSKTSALPDSYSGPESESSLHHYLVITLHHPLCTRLSTSLTHDLLKGPLLCMF